MTRKIWLTALLIVVLSLASLPALAQQYDFGGNTVTFVGWVDNLDGLEIAGRLAEAEALFNVKIERVLVPQDDYQAQLTARLLSGDSEYDVWRMTQNESWFLSMASQEQLLAVSDILGTEYYGEAWDVARAGIEAFTLGGRYYAVSLFPNLVDAGTAYWTVFNKDIIEDAGLPDPYELYFAGEWTWDAMRDIALATTVDFNGDGVIDQWGIANMYEWAFLTSTNGDNIFIEDENGKILYNWNSERILEGIAFGHQLRYVDQVVTSGFGAFEDGNAAIGFGEGWRVELLANSGKVNYGILPLPKGPHGDNTLYTGWVETWVLPANTAQPEEMVALVDFLFRTENIAESTEATIEGRIAKWAPDIKGARVMRDTLEKYSQDGVIFQFALTAPEVNEAYGQAIRGEKTPAEALNAVASVGQAYIDDILGY